MKPKKLAKHEKLDIGLLWVKPEMRGVALTLMPQMPPPTIMDRLRVLYGFLRPLEKEEAK